MLLHKTLHHSLHRFIAFLNVYNFIPHILFPKVHDRRKYTFTFYIRLTTWYGWNRGMNYKISLSEIYDNN